MKRLMFFLSFLSVGVMAQLPTGVDPSTVSKADLDKYGVTDADLKRLVSEYGGSGVTVAPATSAPIEVVTPSAVVKEKEVKEEIVSTMSAPVPVSDNGVYGKSLFAQKNLKIYENASHIKASPNYVLGSGDELSISIWGYSEHSGLYSIGADGAITPKLVGKIYLKGQTFETAKKLIEAKFGGVYDLRNSQISIELNYSKVIRVNIVGEVNSPGTYSVPAVNPVFNILSLAGGITTNGSVRNIQIKRNGKIVNTLDVYEFMKNPSYNSDFFLMENDFILVNVAGSTVEITGSIKRPMTYELKENEGINELLNFAGGFQPSAYKKRINLNRFQNNRDEIIEINYDSLLAAKTNFKLKAGDRLFIPSVPSEVRNRVAIKGAVNIAGSFVLKPGMIVKDLIETAEGLSVDAYGQRAYILRLKSDYTYKRIELDLVKELNGQSKTLLKEFDELTVYSKTAFVTKYEVKVLGAIKNPGSFSYTDGITLGDVIFMAGGLLPEAAHKKIEISRISEIDNKSDAPARIIVNNIEIEGELLSSKNDSIKLMPNDLVIIRSVPNYQTQTTLTLQGEFMFPGVYVISDRNETLSEIIERAGGLSTWAHIEGAHLRRVKEDGQQDFIVFDMKDLLKKDNSIFDYVVKPGDILVVPSISNFVSIYGEVEYPKVEQYGSIKVPYVKGKRAKYYINEFASGFSKEAKRSRTYVETPGGYVKKTRNFGLFKIYPIVKEGDKIVANKKLPKNRKEKKETEPVNWNRFIESTMVKLTGLATFYILMQSIIVN